MKTYGNNVSRLGYRTWYKRCLGVLQCPNCDFIERPKVPRRGGGKSLEHLSTPTKCSLHNAPLEHISCDCTLRVRELGNQLEYTHHGFHNHLRPHPIRPTPEARQKLEDIILAAPEARPKSLMVGTSTRPSVSKLHDAFHHHDRVAYIRSKVLSKFKTPSTIGSLLEFNHQLGEKVFIRGSSICPDAGFILMQTKKMMQHLTTSLDHPLQTDSVHDMIQDAEFKSEVNITFTSSYDASLGRTVPLLISILFGKTALHYQKHFEGLFSCLKYTSFQDFHNNWPGMTCDFSQAEQNGFLAALKSYVAVQFPDSEAEVRNPDFMRFCEVHYKRSATRIRRNGNIIPRARENDFYNDAIDLLRVQDFQIFSGQVLKMFSDYPRAKTWLQWYLQKDRAPLLYPACDSKCDLARLSAMSPDTNAQESLGNDFKRCAPKIPVSIMEAVKHAWRYCLRIEEDTEKINNGARIRYRRRECYVNDGRAPDTTEAVLGAKRRRAGRPVGATAKQPAYFPAFDIKESGMPWSGLFLTNTCPLDSTLMLLWILVKTNTLQLPRDSCFEIKNCLNLMTKQSWDEARMNWIMMMDPRPPKRGDTYDLLGSLSDVQDIGEFQSLTTLVWHTESICGSDFCPRRTQTHRVRRFRLALSRPTRDGTDVQKDVDSNFNATTSACTVEVPNSPDLIEGTYRKMAFFDPDNPQDAKEWFACAGERSFAVPESVLVPSLLIIHASRGTSFRFTKCRWVSIGQHNFHLAAAIFGNDNHFVGCCFISSYCLFYDGIPSTKLQWVYGHSVIPEGYSVAQLWYLKSERREKEFTQDDIAKQLLSLSQLAKKTKKTISRKTDIGWSIALKGAGKGTLPKCKVCNHFIPRSQWRFKYRKVINPSKGWKRTQQVHFDIKCLSELSHTEKKTFVTHLFEEDQPEVIALQQEIRASDPQLSRE